VYSAKEGWDPLVKFLGVPKPDVPFPQVFYIARFPLSLPHDFAWSQQLTHAQPDR
jgi:hypothetical protein